MIKNLIIVLLHKCIEPIVNEVEKFSVNLQLRLLFTISDTFWPFSTIFGNFSKITGQQGAKGAIRLQTGWPNSSDRLPYE